jgi:hypothetical protein
MPRVQIPGVGIVEFPDSMSPEDIAAQAAKLSRVPDEGPTQPPKRIPFKEGYRPDTPINPASQVLPELGLSMGLPAALAVAPVAGPVGAAAAGVAKYATHPLTVGAYTLYQTGGDVMKAIEMAAAAKLLGSAPAKMGRLQRIGKAFGSAAPAAEAVAAAEGKAASQAMPAAVMKAKPIIEQTSPITPKGLPEPMPTMAPEVSAPPRSQWPPVEPEGRDALYQSMAQERIGPGARVTGITPKGEAALQAELEAEGLTSAKRQGLYKQQALNDARYKSLLDLPYASILAAMAAGSMPGPLRDALLSKLTQEK